MQHCAHNTVLRIAATPAAYPAPPLPPPLPCRFFDPGLGNRALERLQRRPRASFQFVEEGRLQKQAETGRLRVGAVLQGRRQQAGHMYPGCSRCSRFTWLLGRCYLVCPTFDECRLCLPVCPSLQAQYGDGAVKEMAERRRQEAAAEAGGGDANLIPLGTRVEAPPEAPLEPIPDVEWWDARVLADKASYGGAADGQPAQVRRRRASAAAPAAAIVAACLCPRPAGARQAARRPDGQTASGRPQSPVTLC